MLFHRRCVVAARHARRLAGHRRSLPITGAVVVIARPPTGYAGSKAPSTALIFAVRYSSGRCVIYSYLSHCFLPVRPEIRDMPASRTTDDARRLVLVALVGAADQRHARRFRGRDFRHGRAHHGVDLFPGLITLDSAKASRFRGEASCGCCARPRSPRQERRHLPDVIPVEAGSPSDRAAPRSRRRSAPEFVPSESPCGSAGCREVGKLIDAGDRGPGDARSRRGGPLS